jgi:hypothetical protein
VNYRIVVTGADGTGRTGLAKSLAAELQVPWIEDETAAQVRSLGYQTLFELPDSIGARTQLFENMVRRQSETPTFVSDASTFDWYSQWQRWEWNNAPPAASEALYQRVKDCAADYSHVIFLQPSFQPPYDGFRWTDPDNRSQVTRLIRTLIQEFDLGERTLELTACSPESALDQAKRFIRSEVVR